MRSDEPRDVWATLRERVDRADWRPRLAADVEVRKSERGGRRHVLVGNPRTITHYKLNSTEGDVLPLLDGTRTLRELMVAQVEAGSALDPHSTIELVKALHAGGLLEEQYVDVPAALTRGLDRPTRWRSVLDAISRLHVEWPRAEGAVRLLYRAGLRYAFSIVGVGLGLALAIGGLASFVATSGTARELDAASPLVALAVLWSVQIVTVLVHELGHALALVHFGRRVKSAGVRLYFGTITFFIDSSDALMLDRRRRMVQSLAGPYAEAVVAGAAAALVAFFPESVVGTALRPFVALSYLLVFLNLIPLLELDGYWILTDALELPDLRQRSLRFIRAELWTKLARRQRFTRSELALSAYGVLGVAFTVVAVAFAGRFWVHVFGRAVGDLWRRGPLGLLALGVLALLIGSPLWRALRSLLAAGLARGRLARDRSRFRRERDWRVEAAQLLDRSGAFGDLPVDVLNDIAGRVSLRVFGPGEVAVRQGDRAGSYFVIRSGSFEVCTTDPGADEEARVRLLRRGAGFGDVGLAERQTRTATVRAVELSEAFEVDVATFDRLLSARLQPRDYDRSAHGIAELSALPVFGSLDVADLRAVLDAGDWVTFGAGHEILREGEPGREFYAVQSGQLEVTVGAEVRRRIGPGASFGELALLTDSPRSASVRAVTPSRLFRLSRPGFDTFIAGAYRRGPLRPAADRTWEH